MRCWAGPGTGASGALGTGLLVGSGALASGWLMRLDGTAKAQL